MKFNKEQLKAQLVIEQNAKNAADNKLDAEIRNQNELVRANKKPDEELLKKLSDELGSVCQWYETLDLLYRTCERLGVEELTDEQVKTRLIEVYKYTSWGRKVIKETGCFKKDSRQVTFDFPEMFKKLGVNTDYVHDFSLFRIFVALRVGDSLGATNKDSLICTIKKDPKVAEKIAAGADLSSKRTSESALKEAVDSFLQNDSFKFRKEDIAFITYGVTQRDKKNDDDHSNIKVLEPRDFNAAMYDYIHNLVKHNGTAVYGVTFKKTKKSDAAEASTAPTEPEAEKPVKATEPEKPTVKRGRNASPKSESKKSKTEKPAA